MSKKVILMLLLLLPIMGKAQLAVGDWKIHTVFDWNDDIVQSKNSTEYKIIDTPNKVYYLVDNYLYCYDKNSDESISYTKKNKLNDILVSNIFYNYDKNYLLVAYKTSNIDIIKSDGTIINVPDIKDAVLNSSKSINDVTFDGNKAYIATNFGFVVMNDEKFEVKESYIYNVAIKSVAKVGKKILIANTSTVLSCNEASNHANYASLSATKFKEGGKIRAINDDTFFFNTGYFYLGKIVNDTAQTTTTLAPIAPIDILRNKTGYVVQTAKSGTTATALMTLDADGNVLTRTALPTDMLNSLVTSYDNDGTLWQLSINGLRKVQWDGTTETVVKDFFKPNASTIESTGAMVYNSTLSKLYLVNATTDQQGFGAYWNAGYINSYDGTTWKDETPATATSNNTSWNHPYLNTLYSPVFDPNDPHSLYVGTWYEGIHKLTDGVEVAKYDWKNSPIAKELNWYCCVSRLCFDKAGNLWAFEAGNSTNPLSVLPKAKLSLQSNVTTADWIVPKVTGFLPGADYRSLLYITKKDDLKFFNAGTWQAPLIAFNDGGDPAATNITNVSYSTLTDQDEKEYKWNYVYCFTEDKNGKIWMGTSNGVVEFDPTQVFDTNFRINRIKVPRNDGTSYADYLLSDESVTCIAVDGANRKWIGTRTSGVFLVSADGATIIKKLNTDNSYLTDNYVRSICCNPNTNSVYIGTLSGTLEYSSDATPASENYENVIAYPNPVKPDYTGLITVRGLMDNSLVKIADAAGNVVKSLQSTGGMVTWDGCNSNGQRVKTGVYYVLASQNESGTSSGVVTKIMIIR